MIFNNLLGLLILFLIQNFFLRIGMILVKKERKWLREQKNNLFMKITGFYLFSLKGHIFYKILIVVIYFLFIANILLSFCHIESFNLLKNIFLKLDCYIIYAIIGINYFLMKKDEKHN